MRKLSDQTGVAAPDANNLKGKIVAGVTPVSESIYGDVVETVHKMVSESGITENSLPDNETNGHQLLDALNFVARRNAGVVSIAISANTLVISEGVDVSLIYRWVAGNTLIKTISFPNLPTNTVVRVLFYVGITPINLDNTDNINTGDYSLVTIPSNTLIEFTYNYFIDKWVPNFLTFKANNVLKTKTIDIGDWDMDASDSVSIAHGIADFKKIRSVNIIVRNDTDNAYYKIETPDTTGVVSGGVSRVISTVIDIFRLSGGFFDGTAFDSTSYNRGWITIQYE